MYEFLSLKFVVRYLEIAKEKEKRKCIFIIIIRKERLIIEMFLYWRFMYLVV